MKKIIRLTESDLARIVRRVINEEGESYDILDLTKYPGRAELLDGKGNNILNKIIVRKENDILISALRNKMFDEGEKITMKYYPDEMILPGLKFETSSGTENLVVLEKSPNATFRDNFTRGEDSIVIEFNVSAPKSSGQNEQFAYVDLKSKNLKDAKLMITVSLGDLQGKILSKTNESYRRRYRRY